MLLPRIIAVTAVICAAFSGPVLGSEPVQCRRITFADSGQSFTTTTTAVAKILLQGLNYKAEAKPLTLSASYTALATDDVDVFLGGWMPIMQGYNDLYSHSGAIDAVRVILTGAKYTLATNRIGVARGIKDFSDISKHKDLLENRIHGVEPGSIGNLRLLEMAAKNQFQLGTFEIVESSVQGMLSQVDRANKLSQPIVFLAWEPHPLISEMKPTYLSGGEDIFGPDNGAAEVYTMTRAGYETECSNIGTFLTNLTFTADIYNEISEEILVRNTYPEDAAKSWLKKNPDILKNWLDGVTTADGNDPHSALRAFLES